MTACYQVRTQNRYKNQTSSLWVTFMLPLVANALLIYVLQKMILHVDSSEAETCQHRRWILVQHSTSSKLLLLPIQCIACIVCNAHIKKNTHFFFSLLFKGMEKCITGRRILQKNSWKFPQNICVLYMFMNIKCQNAIYELLPLIRQSSFNK